MIIPVTVLGLCLLKYGVFQIGAYVDDAQYVVLARSILEGQDYGLIDGPGAAQPSKYPFGWPLILALTARLFGWSLETPKIVSLCFTIANVVILLSAWRALRLPSRHYGFAAAALYGLSHTVVGLSATAMSEAASLFFVLVSLILTNQVVSRERTNRTLALALGASWLFAGVVRTIGVTAVAACALWLIRTRKWAALVLAGAGAAATFLIVDATTVVDARDIVGSSMYVSEMNRRLEMDDSPGTSPGMASVFMTGATRYAKVYIPDALVPFAGTERARAALLGAGLGVVLILLPFVLALLLFAGAIWDIISRGLRAEHLYLPAYLAVVAVWPWFGERFLYGVLPFLFVYFLQGIHFTVSRVAGRAWPGIATKVTVLAFLIVAALQGVRSLLIQDFLDHVPDLKVGMEWVAANTPPDAILMAEQTQSVYLYSGRKSVPMVQPQALVSPGVGHPDYVLIAPALVWRADGGLVYSETTAAMASVLQAGSVPAELLFQDDSSRVYVYRLIGRTSNNHQPGAAPRVR